MSDASAPSHWSARVPVPLAAFGVLLSSIGFGLVPYFSRGLTDQGMAPHAVAFYRYALTAVFLMPVIFTNMRHWREISWGLASGVFMGIGWIGFVSALETAPASTVSVLYMTYPVFTVLIAWVLFADRPTKRAMVSSVIIVLAAVIAGSPGAVSTGQLPAMLFALAAPVGFGLAISVLVHRLSRVPPLARIAPVAIGAMFGLVPLMLSSDPAEVIPPDAHAWLLVAGIATVAALVPQLIFMVCSPVVGTARTAVLGSVELPTMFAIAFFAFGEQITLAQYAACGLILSAMLLVQSRSTRNVATNVAKR